MLKTKQCFKCSKITPITNFYKHSQMLDGHLNKCKNCTKNDSKEHRNNNLDKIRAYDRGRGFRGTKGRIYNMSKGKIVGDCSFCGTRNNLEKHHPDYNKPKFIVVLCIKCHRNTHAIIRLDKDAIKDLAHFKDNT